MTRNRTRTVKDGDACNGAYLIYVRKPDNLDNSLEVVALMLLARSKYPAQRMLESSLFHLTAQIAQADPSDIDQPVVGVLVHAPSSSETVETAPIRPGERALTLSGHCHPAETD